MFPFFPLFPDPARRKAEPVRRLNAHVARRARARSIDAAHAANVDALLRDAAKKAFWNMGDD